MHQYVADSLNALRGLVVSSTVGWELKRCSSVLRIERRCSLAFSQLEQKHSGVGL